MLLAFDVFGFLNTEIKSNKQRSFWENFISLMFEVKGEKTEERNVL